MKSSKITFWKPARRYPETYPGDCPDHSYVIIGEEVHPLEFMEPGDISSATVQIGGGISLDTLLLERGLPTLSDRYPSLAYGANRNPGTLAIKMQNYGYMPGEAGLVLPVLKGTTRGRDVVACGLSSQGYLYADLIPAQDGETETVIDAWLPLLDPEQLRAMHDGENVRSGLYSVAMFPFLPTGFAREFFALGYSGSDRAFISPILGEPLAYRTIRVSERVFPEMTPVQMMEHILEIGELYGRVSRLIGPEKTRSLAEDLMRFMNARWWIRFNNKKQPDGRYDELIAELRSVIDAHRSAQSTASILSDLGLTLTIEASYDPGPEHTLGKLIF